MSVTINASTSAGLIQTADTSGTVEIQSNGTTRLTVASGGVTANNLTATGTFGGGVITAGTVNGGAANPLSGGTSVDFTGIPSWVKRITVMFSGVSTSGTSPLALRIGDSGGISATGYVSGSGGAISSGAGNLVTSTTGFRVGGNYAAAALWSGSLVINLVDATNFVWVVYGNVVSANGMYATGGTKTLSSALTQLRITTDGGTDTFDAGTINILYEG